MHNNDRKDREIHILLVEDNPGDILLTQKALEGSKICSKLTVAKDGEIAIGMLKQEGEYQDASLPDLILLDLNLPKKDGKEVLHFIKSDKHLKKIPTLILSSSRANQDIEKAYNLHANSYVAKPVNFDSFKDLVKAIENFWFKVAIYPNEEPRG